MKVTIDFGDELEPALQQHVGENGVSVQRYIRNALRVYNVLAPLEYQGLVIGHTKDGSPGTVRNFRIYNTVIRLSTLTEDSKGRTEDPEE
jgi:hypothetical protein